MHTVNTIANTVRLRVHIAPVGFEIDRIEKSEKLIKNLRQRIREKGSKKDELKAVKFIGVEFDPDTYKTGEDEINDYLNKGFQFVRDYQTAGGLVIALGKFDKGRK